MCAPVEGQGQGRVCMSPSTLGTTPEYPGDHPLVCNRVGAQLLPYLSYPFYCPRGAVKDPGPTAAVEGGNRTRGEGGFEPLFQTPPPWRHTGPSPIPAPPEKKDKAQTKLSGNGRKGKADVLEFGHQGDQGPLRPRSKDP